MGNSTMLRQGACPSCDSSDAYTEYDDGHSHCFSCGKTWQPPWDAYENESVIEGCRQEVPTKGPTSKSAPPAFYTGSKEDFEGVGRGLHPETCRKFGYFWLSTARGWIHLAPYYDIEGHLVAQKVREEDKSFWIIGSMKKATLFGQNIWRDRGKMIVITEGEIDALSVSQAQSNRFPVVSIPNGAEGAYRAIQKQLEWLEGFETVVLMFDMDEPGQAAARKCAELFSPQKAKIAQLPLKDANEMLVAGRSAEIIDAIFGAKSFRPHGIVADEEVWEHVTSVEEFRAVSYPWPAVTEKIQGLRRGEVVTICAGTGIGKSLACREIAHHLISSGEIVGYVALEETVKRSALGLLSISLNKPLHLLERTPELDAEMRAAFEQIIQGGKAYFYDHFGSLESEILISKLRYLAKGLGCTYIILDHISIVVSGMASENERKDIDILMTNLASLAKETKAGFICVSHLKRPEGNRGYGEGIQTSLTQLRGSSSIECASYTVIGLERNQQDELAKNITTVRILKDRHTGYTGSPCKLSYEPVTGRLSEVAGFGEEY